MSAPITDRDFEQFSAYLDGQLATSDRSRLEVRLRAEPDLREALEELAATRAVLRRAKPLRAPRNFTISPETARKYARKPLFPALPAFRFSAALSALSLIAVLAFELTGFLPQAAGPSAALAPVAAPAASQNLAAEPTLSISWAPGMPPTTGTGADAYKVSPALGMGGGSGGDGTNNSPINGQVQLPAIAVQGLQETNQPTLAPSAPQSDTAASPILGLPAPGDGGKIISSNGDLREIPTPLSIREQPERGPTALELPVQRIVEIGVIAFGLMMALAAVLFWRAARR